MPFPPELLLVVACCRWPPSPARDAAVRDAAAARIDWDLFPRVVARHRVEGLVHDGLRRAGVQAPPAVLDKLATTASGIVRENLRFAAASARLTRALDAARVPHLFVKGVTLNMLAYGSLGLKRAWDIDLAVDPDGYGAACAVMEAAGFRPACPDPDASLGRNKHSEWADPAGVVVELHASLTDNPLMLPGLRVADAREVAVAPGLALPTLSPDPLFAYLCVHGATHAWSRLKWIADVAALIADADDAEVERLHRAAAALGAGRSGGQALLLIAKLFGRTLPPALDRELRRDPVLRALIRAALGSMTRGGPATELDRLVLGTVPIHLSHFFLARGWRYKWSEAARKLGGGGSAAANLSAWLARRANASKKVTGSAP